MTPPTPETGPGADLLDRAAMGVSLACVVHCLATPVTLALAPSLVPTLLDDVLVHTIALSLALPLAVIGIGAGLRQTRDGAVIALAAVGLMLMAGGIALHEKSSLDVAVTVTGALAVGSAHWRNFLLRRRR